MRWRAYGPQVELPGDIDLKNEATRFAQAIASEF